MVSSESNVAYDGTSSDLGIGAGAYFKPSADFEKLFGFDADLFESSDFMSQGTMPASTVSPQELMMASMDSVPSSTAFPDLTPGSDMLETPNTSPLFADTVNTTETWPTLFPEDFGEVDAPTPALQRQDSTSSHVLIHPGGAPRKRALPEASPMIHGTRHSSVAGIRKKSKPLPAILVDETDPVAVKRARNTAAARKSREKKNAHVETLEAKIAELQAMLEQKDQEIAVLKASSNNVSAFHGQDFDLSALL